MAPSTASTNTRARAMGSANALGASWSASWKQYCPHGVSRIEVSGRYVANLGTSQCYGYQELDASLLLLSLMRFLSPDDPRLRATVLAIAEELNENGFITRYRAEVTGDGLDDPEASFTACSFWLVSALVEIGETVRARQLCERLLARASVLDLYAEELDAVTGWHYGNFPQALTHLAVLNAALHVIATEQARATGRRELATVTRPTWWDVADAPWRAS